MKKKLRFIIIVFLIIFLVIFLMLSRKKTFTYSIKYKNNKFNIIEKHNKNNYYIEVSIGKKIYPFRIYNQKNKKVVKNIYYYKDKEYECVLPIINNNLKIDMMCYKDGIIYNYSYIKGKNSHLDRYVLTIKEYNINNFTDNISKNKKQDDTIFYTNNKIDKDIYISSYRGLTTLNQSIKLFDSDIYESKISAYVNNYYLIADYLDDYEFNKFYIINLDNQKKSILKIKEPISFDSYIQGIINNIVYLYDNDNEKQYSIDISKKIVKEISTSTKIEYYKNGSFTYISKPKQELLFDYNTLDNYFTDYDKFIETDIYYYLFKKKDQRYELYRVDKNNIKVYKYLFNIPTLDIKYNEDYLYYYNNGMVYYYSDLTGLRTILYNNELMFNKEIKYYIY